MKYSTYLKGATTATDFKTRFNYLSRNARGWMDLTFDIRELPDLIDTDLDAAHKMAVSMLRGFYNKPVSDASFASRKENMDEKQFMKQRYLRRKMRFENSEDFFLCAELDGNGEDWMPVIHGGDLGRIQAALHCGRGYRTENHMAHPIKKEVVSTGMMFHSEWSGRAHYYARSAAECRAGIKAILVGRIQRKHLFWNQGDEYSLPVWNYKHLKDICVLVEGDSRFDSIEEYYQVTYKQTKGGAN